MSTPTLGQKIDTLLEPFLRDEAELHKRLEELTAQIELLQIDVTEAERDLAVVGQARTDALQQAAQSDPLLKAVFGRSAPAPAESAERSEAVPTNAESHPLLSPAG